MTNDFLHLAEHLTERYTHYLSLLHQAEGAIELRAPETLDRLERDCQTMLADIQLVWETFERLLNEAPELERTAVPVLHRLRDVIEQTRGLARQNEVALSLWMGELGHTLSDMRLRQRTLRGYDDAHQARRVLTLNA